MASSSSCSISKSTSSHGWTYEVFLSFAGKDTRNGFVGHLYRALDDRGIYTYRDDEQLPMGGSISNELLRSIEESRISVVVFSEKYAGSSWCLDELVKIMDCRKQIGQIVIPVFYHVIPSDVRWRKNLFGECFKKLEARYPNDSERWMEALIDATNISGCDIAVTANGNESDCILKIVHEISSTYRRSSSAEKNLVGIMSRVREVESLLDTTATGVRIIGIWGMGGAGKTTLAWAVYNEISYQFQGSCYVANIRETSKTSGLHSVLRNVLSQLLFEQGMRVPSVLEGKELMATRLRRKKILLVLDDVDDYEQLDALVGSRDWFGDGSRIIITTRNKHCLKKAKVDNIYESLMLDYAEAIQLFSLYAFERSSPPEEFKKHLKLVAKYADGLPLALKVLGSSLYGMGANEWVSTMERLGVEPEDKVTEILKLSFDGLRGTEQKIFLDIACFFKGNKTYHVARILNSFGFCADIGIRVLIHKSLISISKRRLCMHDLLQEMGCNIVRKASNNLCEQNRLWLPEDVRYVLASNTGTTAVEGICLDINDNGKEISFSSDTFRSMHGLRLLYFDTRVKLDMLPGKWFSEITPYPLNNLQWLTWRGYPLDSLPQSFLGEKLVGLEMFYSNIIQLWEGRKNLEKLKFINITYSSSRCTPDFEGTPNLKSLIIKDCYHLAEVHSSLGDLKQLVFLNLDGCYRLKSLPSCLQMDSLEILSFSGCLDLSKFPEIGENMGKLSNLYLNNTSIEELPESIGNLTGVNFMNLDGCGLLKSLPNTIGRLKCLKTLCLSGCSRLEKLSKSMEQIQSLEELFLDGTDAIKEAPSFILLMKNLKILSLQGCWKWVPSLFTRNIDSFKSSSKRRLLSSFSFIKKLNVSSCNLSEEADLSSLVCLEELDISQNPFKCLPRSISQLPLLKILNLSGCGFEAMPDLPSNISVLIAIRCWRLTSWVLDFTKYNALWKISFGYKKREKSISKEDFQRLSTDLVLQSLLQGHLVANHQFSITTPGKRIPRWFSQQHKGNQANLELPLNWCNGNILGFVICAAFNMHASRFAIRFYMIEEKLKHFKPTLHEVPYQKIHSRGRFLWMGFMSFDFFKHLFPELKEDDWTQFKGSLCMQFYHFLPIGATRECAIRVVYKEDIIDVAAIQDLGGILENSKGQPSLKYILDEDDTDDYGCAKFDSYNPSAEEIYFSNLDTDKQQPSVSTACLQARGRMGAELRHQL